MNLSIDPSNPLDLRDRSASPIRLVSTKRMAREEWLKVRQQGIGASEAATAIGINPYQSPLELWMIKTGRQPHLNVSKEEEDSSPLYWGNKLEALVAEHYSRKTGNKVRRVNAVLQHPDPDKSWMLANLDYAVTGNPDVQVLECKTAGEYGARLWKDGVPDYYQCQVQHQLAITGKQGADIAVLICGNEFRVYRVERDEELIAALIEKEREFWYYVETDTPPPADGSPSSEEALRRLFAQDKGITLDWRQDADRNRAFLQLIDLRQQQEQLHQQEELIKQSLMTDMGNASRAEFAQGAINWKLSKESLTLNTKQLTQDHPQLIARYQVKRPGSRRFTVQLNQH